MLKKQFTTVFSIVLLSVFMLASSALAKYPSRVISLIVPFNTGGSTDTNARLLAAELEKILGQRVITLHSGYLPAGYHEFLWDATDQQGRRVSNGVYFYRVQSRLSSVSKKMILLK